MNSKLKKWNEAYEAVDISMALPAQVLSENEHLLPKAGDAVDLACGRAGNAIYLAQRGFKVDAIDISPVVLESVERFSAESNLPITCICKDVEAEGLGMKNYDVIVVSYFLNRELFPQIISALKPNGLLFYQTWSQQKIDDSGPGNPAFRLQVGELLSLSNTLLPLFYREEGDYGDKSTGTRNTALIVAVNNSCTI